jgi:hypothetical protein
MTDGLIHISGAVVAVSAAVVAVWRLALAIHRFARRLEDVHEAVTAQLLANGGSSLVDRVGGLERQVDEERQRQNEMWAEQSDRWHRLKGRLAMPGE